MKYELRKFVAPEFVIGTDVRLLVGQYINNYNIKSVLLVTDNIVQEIDWFQSILSNLEESNIKYSIYNNVSENPRDYEVMEGVEQFIEDECQAIVAVGGGSPIDCAKSIGIVVSNDRHILEFEGVDQVEIPPPPLICIPTTAGTSADISQFAIIRDMERNIKIAIISKTLIPDVSLIDPVVSTSMDSFLTACTGLDALTHAVEALVSNGSSPITDNHALHAIQLISENLKNAITNPNSINFRYNMMVASLEAGLAFSNASLGAVHAMAHSLGGFYDLRHGECNALLLNHVMDYNYKAVPERLNKVGELLGVDLKNLTSKEKQQKTIQVVQNLKLETGIDYSLKKLNVNLGDLSLLSEYSVKDPCIITNPRKSSKSDIQTIFAEAY